MKPSDFFLEKLQWEGRQDVRYERALQYHGQFETCGAVHPTFFFAICTVSKFVPHRSHKCEYTVIGAWSDDQGAPHRGGFRDCISWEDPQFTVGVVDSASLL